MENMMGGPWHAFLFLEHGVIFRKVRFRCDVVMETGGEHKLEHGLETKYFTTYASHGQKDKTLSTSNELPEVLGNGKANGAKKNNYNTKSQHGHETQAGNTPSLWPVTPTSRRRGGKGPQSVEPGEFNIATKKTVSLRVDARPRTRLNGAFSYSWDSSSFQGSTLSPDAFPPPSLQSRHSRTFVPITKYREPRNFMPPEPTTGSPGFDSFALSTIQRSISAGALGTCASPFRSTSQRLTKMVDSSFQNPYGAESPCSPYVGPGSYAVEKEHTIRVKSPSQRNAVFPTPKQQLKYEPAPNRSFLEAVARRERRKKLDENSMGRLIHLEATIVKILRKAPLVKCMTEEGLLEDGHMNRGVLMTELVHAYGDKLPHMDDVEFYLERLIAKGYIVLDRVCHSYRYIPTVG